MAAMLTDSELARRVFPRAADVVTEGTGNAQLVTVAQGHAVSDSAGGVVSVVLDAEAVGVDASVEVPTGARIAEGDEVLVTISGTSPVDAVAAGWGDALGDKVDGFANYFWHDADGAHVATVELDATQGSNVLIDSDSMDIRDGEDVLATFQANKIYLGRNQDISTGALIDLLNGTGTIYADNWAASGGDLHVMGMTSLDLEAPLLGKPTVVRMKIGDDSRYCMAGLSTDEYGESRWHIIANRIQFDSDEAQTAHYSADMADFINSLHKPPKLLWSGTLSNGSSVSVPGIQNYRQFGCKISAASASSAEKRMLCGWSATPGSTLTNFDCFLAFDTGSASYLDKATFTVSGTTVTLVSASQHRVHSTGNVGAVLVVREIWGLM